MTFREWKAGFAPGVAEAWAAAHSPDRVLRDANIWFAVFDLLSVFWFILIGGLTLAFVGTVGTMALIAFFGALAGGWAAALLGSRALASPIHRALSVAVPRIYDPAQIPLLLALLRRIRHHDLGMKSVEVRRTRRAIRQALTRLLPETPIQPSLRFELTTMVASRFRDTESCDLPFIQAVERYLK